MSPQSTPRQPDPRQPDLGQPDPAAPSEDDLLAAEYALGVLQGADQARAAGLAKSSPEFAARVMAWERQLAPLADEVAPVPAPNLLPQIEARLFGPPRRPAWLRLPRGWLPSLLGTAVMAALSVVVVALMLQFGNIPPATPPVQTAILLSNGGDLAFLARLEAGGLILTQTKGARPAAGRSYELWVIDGDKPPLSLGLVDSALTIPAPNAAKGYVLAVTDEPFGGGPGGVPTGPVIAAGSFADL